MAGTIKFFDEMQNASNVSGQDRMMIGKAESGETQVITFDQAKQYLDITSNEIAPIVGGDSEANATPVPAGPAGQTRRADVAPGWIDFGDGPIEAAATNRWMAYWDGSSWSLVDMGELPQTEVYDGFDSDSTTIGGSAKNDSFLYENIHVESGVITGISNKVEGEAYSSRTIIDVSFPFTKDGQVNISIGHMGASDGKLYVFSKSSEGFPSVAVFDKVYEYDISLVDGINEFSINVQENTYLGVFSISGSFWNDTPSGVNSYYLSSYNGEPSESFPQSTRQLQFSYNDLDILIKDALQEVIDSQSGLNDQIADLNTIKGEETSFGKPSVDDIETGRAQLRIGIGLQPLGGNGLAAIDRAELPIIRTGNLSIRFYEKIGDEFHKREVFDTVATGTGTQVFQFPVGFQVDRSWYPGFYSEDGQAAIGMVNVVPSTGSYYLSSGIDDDVITPATSGWDMYYKFIAASSNTIQGSITDLNNRVKSLEGSGASDAPFAILNGTSPSVNESGWYRCCPVVEDTDENGTVLGCTGAYWDSKRDRFIVSEFAMGGVSARLLVFRPEDLVDRDLENPQISPSIKEFDLIGHIRLVQGCWWDYITDTYNIIGAGVDGSGYTIVKLNPETGSLMDKVNVSFIGSPLLGLQPGMFDLDENDNILFKPNNSTDLYVLDRNTYFPVKKTPTLYHEGLAANKFTHEVWVANQYNLIRKYDKSLNQLAEFEYNTFDNENSGSNVEGMIVYKDGSIIMSADCFLHSPPSGQTVLGNALYFFDFEETVNKRLYFDPSKSYKGDGVMYSEILKVDGAATDVVSSTPARYRSGNTVQELLAKGFSETFTTGTYIQISY